VGDPQEFKSIDQNGEEQHIKPKHRVSVDGDLSQERLLSLIKLKAEEDRLDYKTELNFSRNSKDKIEFVRDVVAFANTDGGYIVLGVREVTDGSAPERYNPEGLSPAACNGLDVAKLGQQVESFMAERTNIQLQIHSLPEVENKQFALIYVPPSPHKPVIMQKDGQYTDKATGKNETLFRAGDIFIRKNSCTTRVDQSDMRRLISEVRLREKGRWTEEILDVRSLVQRLDKLIAVLSNITPPDKSPLSDSPRGDSNSYDETLLQLSPEVIQARITDLLERKKHISISRYIKGANKVFYEHLIGDKETDENQLLEARDNYLLPVLDNLTIIGAVVIEYQQWDLLSELQRAFYLLCRRAEKTESTNLRLSKTWVWQEVMIRIYVLGALLVFREHWEQARALILQEVDWEDEYNRLSFWSRYFLIMVSRAGELKENGWVVPTVSYIDSQPWASDFFMSDKDEITNSVIHFDFLQCVYVLAYPHDKSFAHPYPGFKMFYQARVEPLLLKVISGGRLRDTLASVSDKALADIINAIVELTSRVPGHFGNWGRQWSDERIRTFIKTHQTQESQ
jgi:hypothetical protein